MFPAYGPATPIDQLSPGSVLGTSDGGYTQIYPAGYGEPYAPAPSSSTFTAWLNANSTYVLIGAAVLGVLALMSGGRR